MILCVTRVSQYVFMSIGPITNVQYLQRSCVLEKVFTLYLLHVSLRIYRVFENFINSYPVRLNIIRYIIYNDVCTDQS